MGVILEEIISGAAKDESFRKGKMYYCVELTINQNQKNANNHLSRD